MKKFLLGLFLAAITVVAAIPSVYAASATRANQLAVFKKVNSEYLADQILDEFNPLIATTLGTIYTHTQSNTTLAATALSVTVEAGETYLVELRLFVTANASGGLKLDFAGGTATATTFEGTCDLRAGLTHSASTRQTALNTGAGATAALTDIRCDATLVVNAAGTLIIQAAQNASHASDSSIRVGSWLAVRKVGA